MRSLSLITGMAVIILSFLGVLYLALAQVKDPDGASQADAASQAQPRQVNAVQATTSGDESAQQPAGKHANKAQVAVATFGSGCFWCSEAVFERLKGVKSVESGYSGGKVDNPTYKQVCFGTTGHAEVVQVKYDPQVTSFKELLKVFWATHDPTTLNRQGNDFGTQYRSVIFYHDDQQREEATEIKQAFMKEKVFDRPIVTEISPFKKFYVAEVDHQDYYRLNKRQPYCQAMIRPKMEKMDKYFKDKLKPEE